MCEYVFVLYVFPTDNVSNGVLFKESDGVKTLLKLISFTRSRQMALKLMIQLILLEGNELVLQYTLVYCSILIHLVQFM